MSGHKFSVELTSDSGGLRSVRGERVFQVDGLLKDHSNKTLHYLRRGPYLVSPLPLRFERVHSETWGVVTVGGVGSTPKVIPGMWKNEKGRLLRRCDDESSSPFLHYVRSPSQVWHSFFTLPPSSTPSHPVLRRVLRVLRPPTTGREGPCLGRTRNL